MGSRITQPGSFVTTDTQHSQQSPQHSSVASIGLPVQPAVQPYQPTAGTTTAGDGNLSMSAHKRQSRRTLEKGPSPHDHPQQHNRTPPNHHRLCSQRYSISAHSGTASSYPFAARRSQTSQARLRGCKPMSYLRSFIARPPVRVDWHHWRYHSQQRELSRWATATAACRPQTLIASNLRRKASLRPTTRSKTVRSSPRL